ncbi:MAG: chemotaxis protein CheW [Rhodospirillaceae bacterium]|nr:chemotaxis protein CheW [Rhodospirillaceae bacterium]
MTLPRSVLTFQRCGYRFGVPITVVEHVVARCGASGLPGAPSSVLGVINLHGEPVAMIDPAAVFGRSDPDPNIDQRLVIARTQKRRLALVADKVEGVIDTGRCRATEATDLAPGIQRWQGLLGDSDGLIYVYDAESLLDPAEDVALAELLEQAAA